MFPPKSGCASWWMYVEHETLACNILCETELGNHENGKIVVESDSLVMSIAVASLIDRM